MRALLLPLHATVSTLKMACDVILRVLWRFKCLLRS